MWDGEKSEEEQTVCIQSGNQFLSEQKCLWNKGTAAPWVTQTSVEVCPVCSNRDLQTHTPLINKGRFHFHCWLGKNIYWYSSSLYSLFLTLQNILINHKIFLKRFPIVGRWQLSCLCGKGLLGMQDMISGFVQWNKKSLKYLEIRSLIITCRKVTVLLQNFLVFSKGK